MEINQDQLNALTTLYNNLWEEYDKRLEADAKQDFERQRQIRLRTYGKITAIDNVLEILGLSAEIDFDDPKRNFILERK